MGFYNFWCFGSVMKYLMLMFPNKTCRFDRFDDDANLLLLLLLMTMMIMLMMIIIMATICNCNDDGDYDYYYEDYDHVHLDVFYQVTSVQNQDFLMRLFSILGGLSMTFLLQAFFVEGLTACLARRWAPYQL